MGVSPGRPCLPPIFHCISADPCRQPDLRRSQHLVHSQILYDSWTKKGFYLFKGLFKKKKKRFAAGPVWPAKPETCTVWPSREKAYRPVSLTTTGDVASRSPDHSAMALPLRASGCALTASFPSCPYTPISGPRRHDTTHKTVIQYC